MSYIIVFQCVAFLSLRHQRLIQLRNNRIHFPAEEFVHLTETALRIEGRVVQIVRSDVKTRGDLLFEHAQPFHLFGVKFGRTRLLAEHPILKIFVHRFGIGGQRTVQFRDPPDERDEGDEFVFGLSSLTSSSFS